MRTIETPIYNHSDLLLPENKDVLNNVVKNWNKDYFYIWQDAHESVKGFHKFFDFSSKGNRSWLDFILETYEDVEEMKGELLREYLKDNFDGIFSCCPFTGVYYDETLLTPFRNFVNKEYKDFDTTCLKDLLNDAFNSLRCEIDSEIEYRNSEESILESIESNNYEFYEDGKMV